MKIALLGYGKMGKSIEKIAVSRGHEIVAISDSENQKPDLSSADVAINFSIPSAAFENIAWAFENKVPVVSGTTGWLQDYDKAVALCKKNDSAFIYASNFSLGVNLFFELNKKLAKMMKAFNEYSVSIEEIHHLQKLDAPSGTAITLAEHIIPQLDKKGWSLNQSEANKIPIYAKREENVPGTHSIFYHSKIDQIEIKHTAHSREGFAVGAVIAAEWLLNKKGIFHMTDVLESLK
ncbi:MAG TPA: 4-hydroxy-tetrahydrodipicolinate reductase [Salinimicrobium sp.]|nr:4-hydroxy-tetrahydrodipicolinate reductase [Salinimicrobium sp.]